MIPLKIIKEDKLTKMLNLEETWYVTENGFSMEISDCSLMDC